MQNMTCHWAVNNFKKKIQSWIYDNTQNKKGGFHTDCWTTYSGRVVDQVQ